MRHAQKLACLLLAVLMTVPLAACGGTGDKPAGTDTAAPVSSGAAETDPPSGTAETEPPTEMERRASVKDSLPNVNYDGAPFRISAQKGALYEIAAEDITGDTLNDALYDADMVSVITEALNAESYRTMFPTYYEEALQHKYARDPMAIEMLNLLMDGRTFDLCTLFHKQIPRIAMLFRNVINEKSGDFASLYAQIEDQSNSQLDEILEAYEKNAKGD